jgi:hypothetical protein
MRHVPSDSLVCAKGFEEVLQPLADKKVVFEVICIVMTFLCVLFFNV